MGEWHQKTVGELVTLQRGIDLPDAERRSGTIPIMGSFGITGRHDRAACKGPGVTVGRSGASIGVVSYIEEDYWPLNTCLYVRDFHGNHPRFAYYLLKTLDLSRLNSGSAQPSLNRNFVHPLPVAFPEPIEQEAVALLLGVLDDKIELSRQMNETLEAMARAIFKDWFVDFGPTRAKLEGRAPYLAPDIWSLFPDCLDVNGKPAGWDLSPASSLIDFNPSERIASDDPAPYIDMAAVPTTGSWPERPVLREPGSGAKFRNGDTVFARITPCLENGKTAYIQCLDDEEIAWGSTEFIVMRSRAPFPAAFSYLLARDPSFRSHAIQSMTGTSGRQRAQSEALARFLVAVPPEPIVLALRAVVDPSFIGIKTNSEQSETLAALRDLLLPKLMSGEIRVKDAEKMVGETT